MCLSKYLLSKLDCVHSFGDSHLIPGRFPLEALSLFHPSMDMMSYCTQSGEISSTLHKIFFSVCMCVPNDMCFCVLMYITRSTEVHVLTHE